MSGKLVDVQAGLNIYRGRLIAQKVMYSHRAALRSVLTGSVSETANGILPVSFRFLLDSTDPRAAELRRRFVFKV